MYLTTATLIGATALLSAATSVLAAPTLDLDLDLTPAKPLPLLIWHGLGDRYDADGLRKVGELARQTNPGTYVHYINVAAGDDDDDDDKDNGTADRTASFFGNVTLQIEQVCARLQAEPRLRDTRPTTGGGDGEVKMRVDAIGFSQGGQFLRGLLERCPALSIRSLVTFGSQHNGISQFQACGTWDFVCKGADALVRGNVWTDTVQGQVVPAQYFREVNETTGLGSEEYLHKSHFLADINNELAAVSPLSDDPVGLMMEGLDRATARQYKRQISSLAHFVMFVFEDDTTVIPKESGWFADVNATTGEVTPLRERRLYEDDWLGLRALDRRGGLEFRSTPGKHMALDEKVLEETFVEFFGPEREVDEICGDEDWSDDEDSWYGEFWDQDSWDEEEWDEEDSLNDYSWNVVDWDEAIFDEEGCDQDSWLYGMWDPETIAEWAEWQHERENRNWLQRAWHGARGWWEGRPDDELPPFIGDVPPIFVDVRVRPREGL